MSPSIPSPGTPKASGNRARRSRPTVPGLIAAGMGSLSMALITSWLGLPPQAIPAGGAAGSAAYLVGVFGPAVIELGLARLRDAREGGDD